MSGVSREGIAQFSELAHAAARQLLQQEHLTRILFLQNGNDLA